MTTRAVYPLVLLISASSGWAWGPEGHSLVARIAETQLTPAARARIAAILAPGQTIISIASWADDVRRSRPETATWHYIDIPIHQKHLDLARDCPQGNCVLAKIAEMRQKLMNAATPMDQQREALMYLVHFIGDMHQPLHCSDNDDKGGNAVKVALHERPTNLHSVWDSGLLGRLPPADQLFPNLSEESLRRRKKYAKGTVTKWAEESHRSAQKVIYGKLPKVNTEEPMALTAQYERTADVLIREQLEKAGVRLAAVLNDTLR
jgi:hypothetical protein